MEPMSDRSTDAVFGQEQTRASALAADDARLAMMRRVKRMPVAERIALLDRLCREGTRIAMSARRVR
jgi:hypothetical protein